MVTAVKLKILLVLLAILWLAMLAMTWAEAAKADSDARPDDEYSFNWLDPEKKIYVLQNRRYLKANHFLLSVMGGPGLSNPYRTVLNLEPRVAYYFSEAFGVEGFYTIVFNSPNNTVVALQTATATTLPVVREIRSQAGGLAHWVPWYAKINVFNKILYFDWYFAGGAGAVGWSAGYSGSVNPRDSTTTDNPINKFAVFAATGQQFHLNESLTVRLDFMGAFYTAPIVGTAGDTAWYSNYNFGIGFGIRL
jgi:outer membrane beta-barrel protein